MLNKASFRLALSFLVFGLLVLSACGKDKKTDLTAREISNDELALMMLSLEDYGPDFRNFELDKVSGPLPSEEVAGGGVDPLDFGWGLGYQRVYVGVPPGPTPPGTYVASSTVFV